MTSKRIIMETTVNAPIQKVWEVWNQPEHITHWHYSSDDWFCPFATNNLSVGGQSIRKMEAKDGSFMFEFVLTYDLITHHEQIIYTIADGRKCDTKFQSLGDKTKIITSFDPETQNPRDVQEAGWKAILENFKNYTESL